MKKYLIEKIKALLIYVNVNYFVFSYKTWIKMREESKNEYGEKLCYCGHTYKCSCDNPDKKTFKESVKNCNIILWNKNNGWKKINKIHEII